MNIHDLLDILSKIAMKHKTSVPYIVGGVPRDKLLNQLENVEDIDITTGDSTVFALAKEFHRALESQGAMIKTMGDGHSEVRVGGFKVDFSSNYRAPGIQELLQRAGVKEPNDMQMELYSRDFTINSLLMSTDLKTIKDPTGLGINDLERKRIRTNLPARMTLNNDKKRIVRIIYLAAKLNFDVDPEIIKWVRENPSALKDVKDNYIAKKLRKALEYNVNKTVGLLDQMNLWHEIPLITELMPYMKAHPGRV